MVRNKQRNATIKGRLQPLSLLQGETDTIYINMNYDLNVPIYWKKKNQNGYQTKLRQQCDQKLCCFMLMLY